MNSLDDGTAVHLEWLEADGLGGFASGTVSGIRTRRYHALLLTATTPPTGRMVLVNGLDAWLETTDGSVALSSQWYAPGVRGGEGADRLETFAAEPWPLWMHRLDGGSWIEHELFAVQGQPLTCLSWRLKGRIRAARLCVRLFLSGRDYHALHKANAAFRFDPAMGPEQVSWQPYPDVPGISALTNGTYAHDPQWYHNFLYEQERARGLDCTEDLAAPGVLSWSLEDGPAVLMLTSTERAKASFGGHASTSFEQWRNVERRRRADFPTRLHRAADAYIVERGVAFAGAGSSDPATPTKTIIAGYPWFTDWGRDTFIALRGLCLASGRLEVARDILTAWAGAVSAGMLPNRFPDHGEHPEFNSVDASLWFVIAVHEFLQAAHRRRIVSEADRSRLLRAVAAIVEGYHAGTRFGIRADSDGLLACGVPGVQLTWMDAKVGDWVVTPRIGKPVEVQALWLNALWIARRLDTRWRRVFDLGLQTFKSRFWNSDRGMLFDVVDVDHVPGAVDATFRPNQILAAGGLPLRLLERDQAASLVHRVEDQLWTPLGLRSLAPGEAGYAPRYQGGVLERDGVYHQGTVWPWLLGAFVEAWVWTHGSTPAVARTARQRFLEPLLRHLDAAGLGHISEIADAQAPHNPRGCPFQAWSVGEVLRLDQVILADAERGSVRSSARRRSREHVSAVDSVGCPGQESKSECAL